MGDEEDEYKKEKESLDESLSFGGRWASLFGIAGLLWGLLFLIANGNSGIFPLITYTIGGAVLGFLLGFLYGIFPKQLRIFGILIIGIILFLVLFLLIPKISKTEGIFANPLPNLRLGAFGDSLSNFGNTLLNFRYCFVANPRCPFYVNWENPDVKNTQEEYYLNVEFSNKEIIQNRANTLVSISVLNKDKENQLSLIPRCYHGKDYITKKELQIENMGSYSFGDEFIFDYSPYEQHTSFVCSGLIEDAVDKNSYSENLYVDFERPISVKTTLNIYIGEGETIPAQKSVMLNDAPYSIAIISNNDMPFVQERNYPISIVIKRQDKKTELINLDSLDILYSSSDYILNCNNLENSGPGKISILNKNPEELKKITAYSKDEDKYSITCNLIVLNSRKNIISSPLSVESKMRVITKFEDTIKKYSSIAS